MLLLRRLLHDARAQECHAESHKDTGEYLKAVVFGGLDGILTSFAIVAGSAGERTPRLGVEVLRWLSVTDVWCVQCPVLLDVPRSFMPNIEGCFEVVDMP